MSVGFSRLSQTIFEAGTNQHWPRTRLGRRSLELGPRSSLYFPPWPVQTERSNSCPPAAEGLNCKKGRKHDADDVDLDSGGNPARGLARDSDRKTVAKIAQVRHGSGAKGL